MSSSSSGTSVASLSSNNGVSSEVESKSSILQRSRERNKEHARKTRLRKKAILEGHKQKLAELQNEAVKLALKLEEKNTASILLCMSARPRPESVENTSPDYEIEDNSECFASGSDEISLKGNLVDYIRTLVRNEANWNGSSNGSSDTTDKEKQGSESDFASDSDDESQQKSHEKDESIIDLNGLRKERNRMNAKLTRERKKMFTSRIQAMINSLEKQNGFMRNRIKSTDS